jgi:hypothetical protein
MNKKTKIPKKASKLTADITPRFFCGDVFEQTRGSFFVSAASTLYPRNKQNTYTLLGNPTICPTAKALYVDMYPLITGTVIERSEIEKKYELHPQHKRITRAIQRLRDTGYLHSMRVHVNGNLEGAIIHIVSHYPINRPTDKEIIAVIKNKRSEFNPKNR